MKIRDFHLQVAGVNLSDSRLVLPNRLFFFEMKSSRRLDCERF